MADPTQLILFHYPSSPYAQKLIAYLALRHIPYSESLQPVVTPRPSLLHLGIRYRRIPLMAIGTDIYCDTSLMLRKLEHLYPPSDAHPRISSISSEGAALEHLLEKWTAGVFPSAAGTLPTSLPAMRDPVFTKDREEFSGRSWGREQMEKLRPRALAGMREAVEFVEEVLLADGREWMLGTEGPGLADIHAAWVFDWVFGIPGALPKELVSEAKYPKTLAWRERYRTAVKLAKKNSLKPGKLSSSEVVSVLRKSSYREEIIGVDETDPLSLREGQDVEAWPVDTGFRKRQPGKLVGLNSKEIVLQTTGEAGVELRVHFPRSGFAVAPASSQAKL